MTSLYFIAPNTTQPNSDESSVAAIIIQCVVPLAALVVLAALIVLVIASAIILRRQRSGKLQLKGDDNTCDAALTNPTYTGEVDSIIPVSYFVCVFFFMLQITVHTLNHRWCRVCD